METIKTICLIVGAIVISMSVFALISTAILCIINNWYSNKIMPEPDDQETIYMYCDEDGIKWGDGRW